MKRIIKLFNLFRNDIAMLFFAIFNRKTPSKVRTGMILAVLYLLSPIDLVPDTLPAIGMIDDAVLVPMAVMILTNMLPESVKQESATRAWKYQRFMPVIMGGIGLVIIAWILLMFYGLYKLIF